MWGAMHSMHAIATQASDAKAEGGRRKSDSRPPRERLRAGARAPSSGGAWHAEAMPARCQAGWLAPAVHASRLLRWSTECAMPRAHAQREADRDALSGWGLPQGFSPPLALCLRWAAAAAATNQLAGAAACQHPLTRRGRLRGYIPSAPRTL